MNIPISILIPKIIFIKYLTIVRPKLVPKLKVLKIYWNLTHSMFQICESRFWCQKWFLLNIYHLLGPICSKIKNARDLLKFGLFDISTIMISILISKTIFIKYLAPVPPKLVQKLKMPKIYWNVAQSIFQICQSRFWCQKRFLLNICHLWDPNWSQN